MGIGGSDGSYYEDGFDHLTNNDGNKPDAGSKGSRSPSDVSITFRNPNPNPADSASGGGRTPLNRDDPGFINPDTDNNPHVDTRDWNEITPNQSMGMQWNSKNMPTPEPISDVQDRRNWTPLQSATHMIGDTVSTLPQAAEDQFRNPSGQAMVPNTPLGEELGMKELPEPGPSWVDRLSMVHALKGMLNPDTSEDVNTIKGFYNTIKGYMGLAHDVFGGKVDPMSQQGIEKSADLAQLMVFGPAPVASKMAEGTLGSFAGVRAMRNMKNTEEGGWLGIRKQLAEKAERNGMHPDQIWSNFGFMRGVDNKWRYEIDDSKAKFNDKWHQDAALASGNNKIEAKLSDVWDHPDLFKAYPDLAGMKVKYDPKYKGAYYNPDDDSITIGGAREKNGEGYNTEDVLAHEVQHAIQSNRREGFAKGGMSGKMNRDYTLKLQQAYDDFLDEAHRRLPIIDQKYKTRGALGLTPDDMDFIHQFQQVQSKWPEYLQAAKERSYENYMRLAGEVEARNVQNRLSMTEKERKMIYPTSTADRPKFVQKPFTDSGRLATPYGYQDVHGKVTPSAPNVTQMRRAANDNFPEGHPDRPYNIQDPTMIGSKEMDDALDKVWARFGQQQKLQEQMRKITEGKDWRDLTELDKARLNKLQDEHDKL